MGAFGEFKVVVSDDPAYKEGESYDVVLNGDQTFNEYDGTVNAAKAAATEAPVEGDTVAPAESPAEEPAQTVGE